MKIKKEKRIIAATWKRCRNYFCQNNSSDREHSWEQSDAESMRQLDEYFHGSSDRFAMLLSLVKTHLPAKAKVLDAGAGHGILSVALKSLGMDAYATDLHHGIALFEAENIPYKRWHLEAADAPFPDDSFDAVILSQTIEHFTYSPLHPLKEILRILRPGGVMIIDAPNISCFRNMSRIVRGKSVHWDFKRNYLLQEPEIENGIPFYDRHNHEYSYEDLLAIADFFNLKIEDIAYYSSCNRQKRGALAVGISKIRDIVKHWRKGIYAVYRSPTH